MTVMRILRFSVDPADAEQLVDRHRAVVAAVRRAAAPGPGPATVQLARIDERSWAAVWGWASHADAEATSRAAHELPEVAASFELLKDPTAEDAEVVDQF